MITTIILVPITFVVKLFYLFNRIIIKYYVLDSSSGVPGQATINARFQLIMTKFIMIHRIYVPTVLNPKHL